MSFFDRVKRWWNPAEWRDEHPQVTEGGEGHPLSQKERDEDRRITSDVRWPETKTDYSDET
jgi:hypothetical protein